jgi:hypothetical protein
MKGKPSKKPVKQWPGFHSAQDHVGWRPKQKGKK